MVAEYDAFAKDFSKTRERSWPEFDMFFPLIKNGDRVLDLGCGNGRLRKFLPSDLVKNGDYFGLDMSQKLLDIARKHFGEDAFFKGDFGVGIPFGADNFDWVISIAAFHHLLDKQSQEKFLLESFRVMKPGGHIFLTTWVLPKKHFWSNFWKGRVFTKNWIIPFGKEKHPRTYRNVPEYELESLVKKAGFKILKAKKFKDRNYVVLARKI